MSQRGIGALDLVGNTGEQMRQALHMGFANNGIVIGDQRPLIVTPVEMMVDAHAFWRRHGAIPGIHGQVILTDLIAEEGIVPFYVAADSLGVGIEQYFVGIEPV